MNRVILHVDMDAFFASVEVMDNPSLKGKPVIVGGTSERGVVSTCSYEARTYGVKSAMPIFIAKKKCPKGIFLPTRIYRYKEISNRIFNILYEITEKIEPVSIDEAYLDITNLKENPANVAGKIKNKVRNELGLTLSVGISYNKFLAKLASDWNKPDGLKVILEDSVPEILFPLSINKVHGLGEKSVKRLNNIGIFNVEQLYKLPEEFFLEYFGKFGMDIFNRIRGIDNREVTSVREIKSIGRETTLKKDTIDKEELKRYIEFFSSHISENLKKKNLKGKTVVIKIKTSSFHNHTRSKTLNRFISSKEDIFNESMKILYDINFDEPVRLIGVTISSLEDNKLEQASFFY